MKVGDAINRVAHGLHQGLIFWLNSYTGWVRPLLGFEDVGWACTCFGSVVRQAGLDFLSSMAWLNPNLFITSSSFTQEFSVGPTRVKLFIKRTSDQLIHELAVKLFY